LFCFQDCLSINFRLIGGVPPAYLDAHRNPIRGGTVMTSDSNFDVLGVTHTYKAMANDTGHQFSVWESIVPPGAGAHAYP
jgi:hypothetical protein